MRNAIFLLALFCAACSNYSANLPSIKPYRMDIQQGNVVTPKMMMQLRPGMTKAQVRFVMGTPLIADSFHANRWDYFYQMRKEGKVIEQRRVILDFEDEKLKQVRGDVVPADSGATEPLAGERPVSKTAPVTLKPAGAPPAKEKSWSDKLKFWESDEQPAKPEAKPAPAPATPAAETLPPVAPEEKSEPLPPLMEAPAAAETSKPEPTPAKPEPKPVAKPKPAESVQPVAKPEGKGVSEQLESGKSGEAKPAAAPEAKPAAKAEPKPEPRKVEPRPVAVPEPKPEPKPAQVAQPKPEPKPTSKPADELPAETDPGYFERMLEKIGF